MEKADEQGIPLLSSQTRSMRAWRSSLPWVSEGHAWYRTDLYIHMVSACAEIEMFRR